MNKLEMRETKRKSKDFDCSSRKEKVAISKKEMKLKLIAHRIAMLQDDHETHPESTPENIVQCESIKPMDVSDDTQLGDHVIISKSSKNRKIYGSNKRARVISDDDESSDDREPITCIQPRKKGSHDRANGASDDESLENRKLIACIQTRKKGSQKRARVLNFEESPTEDTEFDSCVPSTEKERSSTMKCAEMVQANLSAKYPSFIKYMLKSHVSGGFWLGLPSKFCDDHLPIVDIIVVLVDEGGQEFNTNYLARKKGLSGGWRGFSIHHDLLAGDVLVFHLIAPTKFKVYIIREQNHGEVEGALGLLSFDFSVGQPKLAIKTEDNTQKVLQAEDTQTLEDNQPQSGSDNELGSEVFDGIYFSDAAINFEDVKSFKDFNINVDGLVIDSKFSDSTRKKYYELCISQTCFLHENLLKGLNCNLVVGIISEIIKIADALNSGFDYTAHDDLRVWEKTLKGFELLGMKVGFLRAHVKQLLGPAVEPNVAKELEESISKRAFAEERMKALEDKYTLLKETWQKIDLELENEIKIASAWKNEVRFKEISAVM